MPRFFLTIKFPISNGYVTLKGLITEAVIGTVTVGGVIYGVYLVANQEEKTSDKKTPKTLN